MKKAVLFLSVLVFVLGTFRVSAYNKNLPLELGNPDVYELYQNYPNPFNPATVISYTLKTDDRVTLVVYNLVGQSVQILVDEFQTAGYKEVTFDAGQLPAGIYLYKIQVGNYSSVKRMTLVK